jgi:hypothetical protein
MNLPNLPTIPQDKLGHYFYGSIITSVVLALTNSVWIAIALCAVVAALKEYTDWTANNRAAEQGLPPPHSVEFLDFVATVAGGIVVILSYLI